MLATFALVLAPTVASALVTAPIKAVSFANSSTGYISGADISNQGNIRGFVSFTKDGGATWHAEYLPGRYMFAVEASLDGAGRMATGQYIDGVHNGLSSGVAGLWEAPLLSRTIDLVDVEYLSGGRRVAVGKTQGNNKRALIASSVNNAAWTIDQQGPTQQDPEFGDITSNELTSIDAAPGGTVAWAVGNDYSGQSNASTFPSLIYKTDNAGVSWASQAPTATPGFNCVSVVDAQTAFIGAESRFVLRTRNGSTWEKMPQIPYNTFKARAIDAVDKDQVLVVGDGGLVYWTANASAANPTWTRKTPPTTNALLGAHAFTATHWIVVGDNETILSTFDGGKTWSGSTSIAAPSVAITSPSKVALTGSSIDIAGTSTDGKGVGVAKVYARVQRTDGKYWSGSAWVASETWLATEMSNPASGWNAWKRSIAIPGLSSVGASVTVSVRAIDGYGRYSSIAKVSSLADSSIAMAKSSYTTAYKGTATITGRLTSGASGLASKKVTVSPSSGGVSTVWTNSTGYFSFKAAPSSKSTYTFTYAGDNGYGASSAKATVTPHAKVTTPVVPRYVKHTKSFRAYTYLYPKHTAGTTAMTFYFQKRGSSGKYYTVKKLTAKARTYSSARSKLTSSLVKLKAGRYRVMARHSDAGHASTDSARKYFTVH